MSNAHELPNPTRSRWFFKTANTKKGPVDAEALRELFRKGDLLPETLVWHAGMKKWTAASQCDEFIRATAVALAGGSPKADGNDDASLRERAAMRRRWIVISGGVLAAAGALGSFFLAGNPGPFTFRRVYGRVQYDDGSLVPTRLRLSFIPTTSRDGTKPFPPSGSALVDPATGKFLCATSRRPGDGIVSGDHTVVIGVIPPAELNTSVIPREYWLTESSPLKVSSEAPLPLVVTIKKPVSKAERSATENFAR